MSKGNMADLRILVIADDPLARAGLASLLAEQPGCAVVGRASGLDDLPALVEVYRPNVLLWDMSWQPDSAIERLAILVENAPPVAVLLPDEGRVAEVWATGARAILRRDADPGQVAAALRALLQGLGVVDDAFAAALARPVALPTPKPWDDRQTDPLIEELTSRELAVLRLVAEGLPNKTIAVKLAISEHTVKFHVNAIFGKLGVASRTEAVVRATRLGLIFL
jgi:two-component system, NarL family, nitrate/nitrite response regulator NarL